METIYLTVREASIRARVHDRTVRRWMDEGLLVKYRTPTGRVRVDGVELDKLLVPTAQSAAR